MLKYQKKGLYKALSMLLAAVMLMAAPIGTTQAYALEGEQPTVTNVQNEQPLGVSEGTVTDEMLDSGTPLEEPSPPADSDAPEATPSDAEETGLEHNPATLSDANEIQNRGMLYGLPTEIAVGTAVELEDAINKLVDGDTIKLTANIDYNKEIVIDGITMTFDVGQYKLNITNSDTSGTGCGLEVKNRGTATLLYTTGELNAFGHYYGVRANGSSTATLTNATATGENGYGAFAVNRSEITVLDDVMAAENGSDGVVAWQSSNITVRGNATGNSLAAKTETSSTIHIEGDAATTGTDSSDVGVFASGSGKITVDGVISVVKPENYVRVNGANFKVDQKILPTTQSGYHTYMHPSYTGADDSVVWVKDADTPDTIVEVRTPEELKDALDNLSDGDTIKLAANIDYNDSITISKEVTFDVGQYTLNIIATEYNYLTGLEVTGSVSLISTTGELNVTGSRIGVMVRNGEAASTTVTNATATQPDGIGIHATSVQPKTSSVVVQGNVNAPHTGVYAFGSGCTVTVRGNVLAKTVGTEAESDAMIVVLGSVQAESCGAKIVATGSTIIQKGIVATGADGIGAWITNAGSITSHGDITATNYIKFGNAFSGETILNKGDGVADTDLPGFTKYTDVNNRVVRVKGVAVPSDKVCEIGEKQYATLEQALAEVQSGDRITLLKDIDYPKGIVITGKHIIFDVGSYKLNITNSSGSGLDVSGTNGRVSLVSTTGELNVTGTDYGIRAWSGGAVTVTNATATEAGGNGIYAVNANTDVTVNGNVQGVNNGVYVMDKANVLVKGDVTGKDGGAYASGIGSVVIVRGKTTAAAGIGVFVADGGNILAHGAIEAVTCGARISNGGTITAKKAIAATGADGVGAWVTGGGSGGGLITIDGAITATNYIKLSDTVNPETAGVADSTKPGYTKYTDGDDRVVWVKAISSTDITSSFTDLKFLAAVRTKLGKGGSDPIYTADVAEITDLGIVGKGITSLAGIEHFTALTTLDCSYNALKTLDVSHLKKLVNLYCNDNQLTTLNVNGLTELGVFHCSNNQLTALDVGNLTKLVNLYCNENKLTTLDVSGSAELVALSCYENKITALNVSGLTNLTKLYCRANQLTALDVSGLTELTELYCSGNKLTELDVSSLPKLTELLCSDNLLTGLVLNGNADYSNIDARSNHMANEGAVTGKNITWDNYRYRFSPQKAPQTTYTVTVQSGTGGGNFTKDSTVSIIANSAPAGQRFKEWDISPAVTFEGDTKKTDAMAKFIMPAQTVTATATYEALPASHYAITVQSDGNGTASANVNSAAQGTEITLTATPNSNHRFKEWQVVSGGVSIVNNKLIMPGADVTVKAIFEPIPTASVTVTFNLNGGTRTGGGELTQTIPSGRSAIYPTVTRSGYTFIGWDKAFTNVTSNLTVTANWSRNGGSSGGGNGGPSDSGSSTVITATPGKTPDQPVTAAASVTATAGANDAASAAIPEKSVTDAIAKAQADAKAQGKTANGIAVKLNVTLPKGATSLTATLTRSSLNSLVSAGVSSLTINGSPVTVCFDQKTLAEIQKQSSGDVTITIKPAQNLSVAAKRLIGTRPVYDITVSYVKDGKVTVVSAFNSGIATISIPYKPGKNEATGYLCGVYADEKGNATRIEGSAYDANAGAILIPTGHLSVYGVGYTAPSAKFTDIGTHWGKESIDYAVGRGLLGGTSETTFAPDTAMTRGMLVTALGRLANVDIKAYTTNSFTDVKADSTFRPYIEWARSKSIVQGIGNGQFAPDRAITREEIAVIFTNYAKATSYKLPVTREDTTYADASSIGSAYKMAVTAMQQAGIMMGGTDNKFNPKASATRAEVSSMLHRYIKLTIDPATAQGWAKNDAGQYLYYKNGKALTGTQTIDSVKYFFDTDGTLKTGWVKDGDNWRYYDRNKAAAGWLDISDKRYYFTKDGLMVSGKWLEIDSKWYYFNTDGSLAKNAKIDGYEVGPDGVRKTK